MPSTTNGLELKNRHAKFVWIGAGLLLAIAGAVAAYFYLNTPANADKETITRITHEVGQMYDLPTDESPQVLQTTDPSKLQGQEFYAKVQKDDYVLLYIKNQLALIYRDKDKKLINVDHATIDQAKK